MAEIYVWNQVSEGDPVIRGQIPHYISQDALRSYFENYQITGGNPDFENYFKWRIEEHAIIVGGFESGGGNSIDKLLKSVQNRIREIEKKNPEIQGQFTDLLNTIVDEHRVQQPTQG